MDKNRFQVIEGGLSDKGQPEKKAPQDTKVRILNGRSLVLEDGWITNTRLMGVFVMGLRFRFPRGTGAETLQEYFYFDAAYYGFDRFEYLIDGEPDAIEDMENSFIGGLGGRKVSVSRREAAHLLRKYIELNIALDLEDPPGEDMYGFLLDEVEDLTEEEERNLFARSCKTVDSPEECINYFLMRWCDQDRDGSRFLSAEGDAAPPTDFPQMTLYSNDITELEDGTYRCRLFGGTDSGKYYLFVITVALRGLRVAEAVVSESMPISPREAMMNYAHEEFVTLLRYTGPRELFDRRATKLTRRAMITEEPGGTLFTIYRTDNAHVGSRAYRIYDDLLYSAYLTHAGEVVCMATSDRDRVLMEFDLLTSKVGPWLQYVEGFNFEDPVMHYFVDSGEKDFMAFLKELYEE